MTRELERDLTDIQDIDEDEEGDEEEETDRERLLIVTIHDEDSGGPPYRIRARRRVLVQRVIDRFYVQLGTAQQEGDRLYCLGSGQDVLIHAGERLGFYQEHSCPDLEWGYSRPTGGA